MKMINHCSRPNLILFNKVVTPHRESYRFLVRQKLILCMRAIAPFLLLSSSFAHAVDIQISQLLDSPDPAVRAGELTYSLSVLNGNNDTASNVVVTLPLPATSTFSSVDNGAACNHDGGTPGTVTCNLGDITGDGLGSPVTDINLIIRTTAATGNTVAITATATTDSVDTNPANNSLNQTTTVNDGADLQIVMSDSPDPVLSSANITYTLAVENNGPNDAVTATLINTLPTNVSYLSASGSGWSCSNSGQDVTCLRAGITSGTTSPDITIVGTVGGITGTITNSATITSTTGDPYPDNNTTTVNTQVNGSADLNISKSVSSPVIGGQNLTFTLQPRNSGAFSADTVSVSDPLPAGFAFVSASGVGWSCLHSGEPMGGTVTCSRASYAVSATDDITIQATAPASGSFTNTASISAVTGDPAPGNNSDTVAINITPDGADLSLSKSKSPSLVVQGGTLTSTLQVTNDGPRVTSGTLTVTDTLSIGETYSGFSGTDWSCTHNSVNPGGIVTCIYASTPLADSASTSNLTITTSATNLGVLTNSASVSDVGGQPDGNAGNNAASGTATSTDAVDLSISKSANTADFNTTLAANEDSISYTITVTNNSIFGVSGIVMSDTIAGFVSGPPATMGSVFTLAAGFTCAFDNPSTVRCSNGANTLPAGASADFIIDVTRPIATGLITNTASVTSTDFADPTPANNTASAPVTVDPQAADLTITKSATTAGGVASTLEIAESTITYTLTATNNGPGPVHGVIVTDALPGYVAGATGVVITTTPAGFVCSIGPTISCNNGNNTLASGASAIFVIEMTRPLYDGLLNNTASITSAVADDPIPSNNTSNIAAITVDPIFDVEMQSKIVTPSTVQAGTLATYVLTVRNNGPSSATGVQVQDIFTVPGGRSFSKLSETPSQGSCLWTGDTLDCNIGTLVNGQSETITVVVRPDWDISDTQWTLTNTATVSYTTSGITTDSNPANESQSASLTVEPAEIDLLVNNSDLQDPIGFDPLVPANSDLLIYKVDISNGGPSLATGLTLTDVMSPKNGKQITFLCDDAANSSCAAGTSLCNNTNTAVTGPASLTITCNLPDQAANTTTRYLFFQIDTAPDSVGDTHSNIATVSANETDTVPANDSEGETTSVRIKTDLAVSVTADTDPVDLRQPFNWTIVVSNNGPGDATQSALSDSLPANMELTGPPSTTQGSCTGVSGDTSFSCSLGTIVGLGNVTITVPVRITDWPTGGTLSNSASVTTFGIDVDSANDSASDSVTVQRASLAGFVYIDNNDNGDKDVGENGIGAIQLQLTGNDAYGNAVNQLALTAADGSYRFDNLSTSDGSGYTLSEPAQPSAYFDGQENRGGTVVPGSKTTDTITAITVPTNSDLTGYLFGELASDSISGFVWHDTDNDGIKDLSETSGIPNITITLTGTDDLGAPVTAVTTTAADGSYTFSDLRPGTYRLDEGVVAGYLAGLAEVGSGANIIGSADNLPASPNFGNRISSIGLQSGDSASGYNFGELLGASLSGTVFNDNNSNGTQEATEPSIPNVTLTLTGNNDIGQSVNQTVITAADGSYSFSNLRPSDGAGYTISETQPAVYIDALDSVGSLGGVLGNDTLSAIPVSSNQNGTGYNFSELSSGISGVVYVDYDNDGILDSGEPPLSGVTINLTGSGQNETTTTDANGYYIIAGLPVGTYTITETQPVGWADGLASAGSAGGTTSSNQISGISLGLTSIETDYNFAERGDASISGAVWHDVNNDGIKSVTETNGIVGIIITLTGLDDFGAAVSSTTTTAVDGSYSYSNLRPGTYSLSEGSVTNYLPGLAQVGSGATVSGIADNLAASPTFGNLISGINLQNADSASDYNFGELLITALSGVVYNDNNADGNQDAGEPGIAGVTVTLSGNDDLGQPVSQATTTAADGRYSFVNLRPSDGAGYTLTETQPTAYTDSVDSVGSLGGVLGNDILSAIPVASDENGTDYNFSELSAGLSGFVYADINNNGSFDSGEPPLPGVTISLSGSGQSETATTDANGYYIITGLPAGSYTLTESQPTGWVDGAATPGSEGGTASTNQISNITLASTTIGTAYNFSELSHATLSGTVFNDNNSDGDQDLGEPGIAAVTLTLSGTDTLGQSVNQTTTSATDGRYSFSDLLPSDGAGYTITETQPADYVDSLDSVGSLGGVLGNDILSAIPVTGSDNGSDYNFAELSAGISGFVFIDSNNDGLFDGGETPLSGVTINLTGSGQSRTATTDTTGYYIINGLPSGTYSVSESQPAAWAEGITSAGSEGGTVNLNQIGSVTLGATTIGSQYNFAERGGSLTGFVYNDLSSDGIFDAYELAIPGVSITLSGVDINGNPVNRTATSAADGRYSFADLPQPNGDGYSLSESQPAGMINSINTLGTLGGTLAGDIFSNILFPAPGAEGSAYNFAEITAGSANVSGSVWPDTNHDRLKNDGTGAAGWTVEIILRDDPLDNTAYTLIATTQTNTNGDYQFNGLIPGIGYEIRFRHPTTGLVYGSPISSEPGVDLSYSTIRGLTLAAGDNILNQSLPLDPAGIVYDSLSRTPITGAVVSISGPGGFDPAIHLVGGLPNASQTTASDGLYQFLLLTTAPAGTYTLSVLEPAGYLPGGSVLIPECSNTLAVTALPDPALVHNSASAPLESAAVHDPIACPATTGGLAASAGSTQYYLSFNLTPGVSGDVVNNHIPLDLITSGAFSVIKSTSKVNVSVGELVPYTISVTNNLAATLNALIDVEDQIPPGFKYIAGSARLDDVALEPQVNGRSLVWPNLTFTANQTRLFKMVLVVGSGVSEGKYVNQAWSKNNLLGQIISNIGTATVRVVPNPIFDCTDIIGKVYDDSNRNGYPDQGEEPLPGVRLATARGWLVTTDEFGRYHIACAAVPNAQRGSNFILKVDERTLPSGYRITTENPRVVRLTRGKVVKANFGAAIHRVVRLDIANDAFIARESRLAEGFDKRIDELLPLLQQAISVLRINYLAEFESEALAEERLAQIKELFSERWQALDCCYNLIIEEEIYWRNGGPPMPKQQKPVGEQP